MGKCIIKLGDKFMQWTSVTDSPVTPLLPEPLFKNFWYAEYGRSGWVDYENMMADAKKTGCSAQFSNVDEILGCNHAGEKGKKLTTAQIIEAYTCDSPEEFLEWSRGRDMAFQKMAVDYGPEENRPKIKKGS